MSFIKDIQQANFQRGENILKAFDINIIEKARSGIYDNTFENRKLGRVGQKYGSKKEKDEIKMVYEKKASTGSIYQIWKLGDVQYKVRFSDHEANILKQDADLDIDIKLKDTDLAKEMINQFIKEKKKNTKFLKFGENKNVLNYDIVERIGEYVYLKDKKVKKYHKNQIRGMFRNENDKEKFLSGAKQEGDYYFKEGFETKTLPIKEFYKLYPEIKFKR